VHTSSKDNQQELEFLHQQSKMLAELLCEWNEAAVEEPTTDLEPA